MIRDCRVSTRHCPLVMYTLSASRCRCIALHHFKHVVKGRGQVDRTPSVLCHEFATNLIACNLLATFAANLQPVITAPAGHQQPGQPETPTPPKKRRRLLHQDSSPGESWKRSLLPSQRSKNPPQRPHIHTSLRSESTCN